MDQVGSPAEADVLGPLVPAVGEDDDLVAEPHPAHVLTDRPHDPGQVGADDMEVLDGARFCRAAITSSGEPSAAQTLL
ncbi:hypothetical protein GCM10023238_30090 [Streptomyces heliomycini]